MTLRRVCLQIVQTLIERAVVYGLRGVAWQCKYIEDTRHVDEAIARGLEQLREQLDIVRMRHGAQYAL